MGGTESQGIWNGSLGCNAGLGEVRMRGTAKKTKPPGSEGILGRHRAKRGHQGIRVRHME